MLTFNTVKRIGEGNYLGDDLFIIERARRARAINTPRPKTSKGKNRIKAFMKHGKAYSS